MVQSGPVGVGDQTDLVHSRIELVNEGLGGLLGVVERRGRAHAHGARAVQHEHDVHRHVLLDRLALAAHRKVDAGRLASLGVSRLVDFEVRRIV